MSKEHVAKRVAHPYIDPEPRASKGNPVVKGTRIKVIDIALRYELMGMTPDQIVEQFPHLTLPQIHDALSFYYEHKEELDRQSQRDQTVIEELKRQYSSKLKSKVG